MKSVHQNILMMIIMWTIPIMQTAWSQTTNSHQLQQSSMHMATIDPILIAKLSARLKSYEHVLSKEDLLKMSTEDRLRTHLIELYTTSQSKQIRRNSLSMLAYLPHQDVESLLIKILKSTDTPNFIIRGAIKAYSYAFKDRSIDILARHVLFHQKISVRLTAIKALGELHSDQANKWLKISLSKETNPRMQREIQHAIKKHNDQQ